MRLEHYRQVFALPGFPTLTIVLFLARIPVAAAGMTLTLYVVEDLDRGYAAAGAAVAAMTVGTTLGAPLLGRLIDRRGLRMALLLTTVGETVVWFTAPLLPFSVLLPFVAVACVLRLPVFSIARQAITAVVPLHQRRQAFALDSMGVELSFMVGPALGVVLVTHYSGRLALVTLGLAMAVSGITLFTMNPPVTRPGSTPPAKPMVLREPGQSPAPGTPAPGAPPSPSADGRPRWLGLAILIQFALAGAALLSLSGTDVALVAVLRAADQVEWTGFVFVVWCAASLVGGFVFGMVRRSVSPALLIGGLALLTVPVGLATGWEALALALIPAGMLCAPALTASTDAVTRLAPASALGEVLGWHGAATTIGASAGAPLAGMAIDYGGPSMGFAAVGCASMLVVLLTVAVQRHADRHRVSAGTAWRPTSLEHSAGRHGVGCAPPPGPESAAGRAGDCRSAAGAGALEPELR